MGRRLTRKQIKQDQFVSLVDRVFHWLEDNWRQAAVGLGAAALVGLIWWGTTAILALRSGGAARALAEAMEKYNAPVGASAPEGAALSFASDSERLDAAQEAFQEVASRLFARSEKRSARLFLARIAAERGDEEAAIRQLTELARKGSSDPLTRVATLDLIRLRTAQGEGQMLVAELEAMIAGKDPRLPRDVALFELATLMERESRPDEALRLFRKLVEDFPESPYRSQAEQRIAAAS